MKAIPFILAILLGFFLIVSYGNTEQKFDIEKKYYLKDCLVKINFNWKQSLGFPERVSVTREMRKQIKLAIVANEFPYFSGHTTRENNYYMLYFADKCEDRRAFTEKLIQEYFISNIDQFPKYSIEDRKIEPGFDGVMPSGLWLDEKPKGQ